MKSCRLWKENSTKCCIFSENYEICEWVSMPGNWSVINASHSSCHIQTGKIGMAVVFSPIERVNERIFEIPQAVILYFACSWSVQEQLVEHAKLFYKA